MLYKARVCLCIVVITIPKKQQDFLHLVFFAGKKAPEIPEP